MRNNLVIQTTISLKDALKRLDSLEIKTLFVLDNNEKLIGTLTDGDVRRAIISGHQVDESIELFMNRKPHFAYENDSIEYKLSMFEELPIRYLAILNNDDIIVNILSKDEITSLTNYAIIMAGGLGSRLGELTKDTPKPLLKVGSKPILEAILESFSTNDINNFLISVNYKSEMIKEYFGKGEKLGLNISYIEELKKLGTAGCLSLIEDKPTEAFFVMNGDVLVDIDFKDMLSFHLENNFIATMGVVSYYIDIPYGVIEIDSDNTLKCIKEKPKERFYVNAGVYLLNPETIEMIPKNSFYDMPSLFEALKNENKKVGVYNKLKNWLDIGHIDDYKKAQKIFE